MQSLKGLGLMKIFKHEGHTAYEFKKDVVGIKNTGSKVRFYFPKAGLFKGFKGLCNIRFIIRPHKQFQCFYWLIRLPFFYWERNGGGVSIGLPNLYMWFIH
jgi:hypothetical protein